MNKRTKGKLAAYSAMIAGFTAADHSYGQVIYVDIEPDIELYAYEGETYDMDINGDLLPDFRFSADYFIGCEYCDSGYNAMIIPLGVNQVAYIADTSFSVCYGVVVSKNVTPALNAGAIIDAAMNFYNDELILASRHFYDHESCATILAFGQWAGVSDKYVALQFQDGADIYYGWVRLSVDVWYDITVADFGFQTTPATPITAGFIPSCFPPEPLGAGAITTTTAKLKWNIVDEVDHYELQYRPSGAADWITKTVEGIKTFRKVAGLFCDSLYEWRIRSICTDGEISLYSDVQTFTTASCRLENETSLDEENIEMYAFSSQLHVAIYEDITDPIPMILFDMAGRKLFEAKLTQEENSFELNIPGGIYIVTVYASGNSITRKLFFEK